MNAMGYRISPNGWEAIPEDGLIIKLDFTVTVHSVLSNTLCGILQVNNNYFVAVLRHIC